MIGYKLRLISLILLLGVSSALSGCNDTEGGSARDDVLVGVDNAFTPVVISVLAPPVPVKGSDGRFHLVYELVVTNSNNFDWQVLSVEVLDGTENGNVLTSISGEGVGSKMQLVGTRAPGNTLEPAQTALIFMTFAVDSIEDIPQSLLHRVTVTVPGGLPQFIVELLQLQPGQEEIVEIGGLQQVSDEEAVVLGKPLEGTGWIAANGCCDSITHIRSALPINGQIQIAQRFAIDWIKVNEDNRLFVGDPQDLNSWFGYGQNVLAVADGLVVTVVDKFPDQTPFILPADVGAITLEEIDGNHVVLAFGNGQFVFYAHLQPGSITVKEGDTVTKGQAIGLLGNTGNSGAPHLHIHVMSSASTLGSNGLPYTFEEFDLTGRTTEESFFEQGLEDTTPFIDEETGLIEGNQIEVLPVSIPGIHMEELPLDLSIVEFP
ncbi:MAG: M23 family metallopeptidase [Thermodesulfobacteriota bacterium]